MSTDDRVGFHADQKILFAVDVFGNAGSILAAKGDAVVKEIEGEKIIGWPDLSAAQLLGDLVEFPQDTGIYLFEGQADEFKDPRGNGNTYFIYTGEVRAASLMDIVAYFGLRLEESTTP